VVERESQSGGGDGGIDLLDWSYWHRMGGAVCWKEMLEQAQLKRPTCAGAPLESGEFVADIKRRFGRQWRRADVQVEKREKLKLCQSRLPRFR
jgi:hypothetical protein